MAGEVRFQRCIAIRFKSKWATTAFTDTLGIARGTATQVCRAKVSGTGMTRINVTDVAQGVIGPLLAQTRAVDPRLVLHRAVFRELDIGQNQMDHEKEKRRRGEEELDEELARVFGRPARDKR